MNSDQIKESEIDRESDDEFEGGEVTFETEERIP